LARLAGLSRLAELAGLMLAAGRARGLARHAELSGLEARAGDEGLGIRSSAEFQVIHIASGG